MERREFFQSLIAGGASVKSRREGRNRRAHHQNERVYHGPMAIPERIAAIVADHPGLKRTTDRHLVSRYAEEGWTWLFRCQIPASRQMVGEIVRTPEGKMRVHCWSAARDTSAEEPAVIVGRKSPVAPAPLLPPICAPAWRDGFTADRIVKDDEVTEYLPEGIDG